MRKARTMASPVQIRTFQAEKNVDEAALLTPEDVAKLLNVSRDWVIDHATRRNPRLPVVRLGGRRALLRFRTQDIHNFVAHHLVQEGRV